MTEPHIPLTETLPAVEGAFIPFSATLMFDWPNWPLSMNDRFHKRVHDEKNADIRNATQFLAARLPAMEKVAVTLTWVVTTHGRRDGINGCATLKPMQDGLVLAGVVPDDTPQYMWSPIPLIEWRDKKRGHVPHLELLVERLPVS